MTTTTDLQRHRRRSGASESPSGPAGDVIAWAAMTFPGRLAVAASMQDGVLPHLASRFAPDADVLFLDTGYHFAETLEHARRGGGAGIGCGCLHVRPVQTVAEQDAQYGAQAARPRPEPVLRAAQDGTARRRARPATTPGSTGCAASTHPPERTRRSWALTRSATWSRSARWRAWSDEDLNELHLRPRGHGQSAAPTQGYPSIGCAPCTRAVAPGADPRSGRWAAFDKTECGIHL
mgnify:CR=1 FL=1